MTTMTAGPLARLSSEQLDALGRELDSIHDEVFEDLGDRDRRYITSIVALHRRLVVLGRLLLIGSRRKPAWIAGTSLLSLGKILENMEIGHNVMHGQWDWMNDPQINSSTWDWDAASTAEAWKYAHNYIHHTHTNILGKDRDLGYEIMRIDPQQPWNPIYLLQPFYNVLLAAVFEWGVAMHDLDIGAIRRGEKSKAAAWHELKGMGSKARRQVVKDYLAFPALSGRRGFKKTVTANLTANVIRNVWAYMIIFCGHFPDQTYSFTEQDVAGETRGAFYVRQLLGSANIEGSALFHVLSGNLGHQVEHHLFPDMPSTRYAEIAPRVKDLCERYELPYNTGPLFKQLGMVQRTILRLALPGGRPRPKPEPYHAGNGLSPPSPNSPPAAPVPDPGPTGPYGSGPEQPTDGVRVTLPDRG
jgi:fatty acid desaturase